MTSSPLFFLCAASLLALGACAPASTCTDEFVTANDHCAAGCRGIPVTRQTRCNWSAEALTWCTEETRAAQPEHLPCIIDTNTDTLYRSNGYPEAWPEGVRLCNEAERALVGDFTDCDLSDGE